MSAKYGKKNIYKWKPMLRRPLGRPKNRWEYNITKGMKKLKIKNWTSRIQNYNKWDLPYMPRRPKRSKNEVVARKEEKKYR
jgi:hypothetical protein